MSKHFKNKSNDSNNKKSSTQQNQPNYTNDSIFDSLEYAQSNYEKKFSDTSDNDSKIYFGKYENSTRNADRNIDKNNSKTASQNHNIYNDNNNERVHVIYEFIKRKIEQGKKKNSDDSPEDYYKNRNNFLLQFDLIKDIQILIKRHYKKIICMAALFVAFFSIYLFFLNFNTSSMNISFRYAEMEKGLNPDGTRFNIYEILSDDVLGQVVDQLDNDRITIKYLRNRLVIVDSIPAASQDKIVQSVVDGYENYAYLPSDYTVSYSQVLGPLGARKILSVLSEVYSKYFVEHHVINTKVLQPDFSEIESTDYINTVEKLHGQLTSILTYLLSRKNEDIKYVSKTTGKSYGDLSAVLDKIINVDLEAYRSFIIKSSLTTDKDALVRQLHYAINLLEAKYRDDSVTYDVMREGLEKYDQTVTKVVFIPTLDKNNEYYMARTNTGIDYLTENAEDMAQSMEETSKTIEEYKYLLNNFKNEIKENSNQVENIPDNDLSASKETADKMLNSIITRTEDICETAIQTETEYIRDKEKSIPVFGVTLFGLGLSSNIKRLMMGAFIGLLGSFVFIVFIERFIKYLKKLLERNE